MAFCSKCGSKLAEGAKYCTNCGNPVYEHEPREKRVHVYEGTVHKCPNCGEIIGSFTTVCPACGFEFRDIKASRSVKELEEKLEKIEASRQVTKRSRFHIMTYDDLRISAIDAQKISLIRNYAIPNTKEDLYEFIILASSNIDTSLTGAYVGGYHPSEALASEALSNAWAAKLEQAYEKACLSFGNDPDFYRIQAIYQGKKKAVSSKKRNRILIVVIIIIGWILLMAFLCGPLYKSVMPKAENEVLTERSLNIFIEEGEKGVADNMYNSGFMKM